MLQSKTIARWLCITLALSIFSFVVFAQTSSRVGGVPRFVKFKGQVKDSSGLPLNGQVQVRFAIYDEPTGGGPIWQEIQIVQFSNGYCSVFLGLGSPGGIPAELFQSGQPRWLGLQPLLEGEQEHQRVFLTSVPYALKASDADTLGGLPSSAFVRNPAYGTQAPMYQGSSESNGITGGSTEAKNGPYYNPATSAELHSAVVQSALTVTPSSSGVITGPVTINGTLTSTNSGPFTTTQMEQYLQSIVNNCSPQTEFQAVQGSDKYATDGLTSCLAIPSSAIIYQANTIAAYGNNSSGTTKSVALSGFMRGLVNGTQDWGTNTGCADNGGLTFGVACFAAEFDTEQGSIANAYSAMPGVLSVYVSSFSPPSFASAFTAMSNQTKNVWPVAFLSNDQAATNFASIGAQGCTTGRSSNCPSQPIIASSISSGFRILNNVFQQDSSGNTNFFEGQAGAFRVVNQSNSRVDFWCYQSSGLCEFGNHISWPAGLGAVLHIEGPNDEPMQIGSQNNQNIILAPNGAGQTIITSLAGRGNGLVSASDTGQVSNAGILISTGTGSSCITGSTSYARCSSIVSISPAQPNTSFIPSCNGSTPSGAPAILSVTPASTSSITVTITNGTNDGAVPSTYGTLYCIAIQPPSL
jgi:hypothetical protein